MAGRPVDSLFFHWNFWKMLSKHFSFCCCGGLAPPPSPLLLYLFKVNNSGWMGLASFSLVLGEFVYFYWMEAEEEAVSVLLQTRTSQTRKLPPADGMTRPFFPRFFFFFLFFFNFFLLFSNISSRLSYCPRRGVSNGTTRSSSLAVDSGWLFHDFYNWIGEICTIFRSIEEILRFLEIPARFWQIFQDFYQ